MQEQKNCTGKIRICIHSQTWIMAQYGEGFFSKMTRQMLRGIRVKSKEELTNRIYRYFAEINEEPIVFH